jgi:hypothetical protein
MKQIFCKLFELPEHQVLITKTEDNSGYGITQETALGGCKTLYNIRLC